MMGMGFATTVLAFSWLLSSPTDTSVVARVGRFGITVEELLESYEVGPSFVTKVAGQTQPLRLHLEYMIYERLIALQAEQLGYNTTDYVRERIAAIEEDLAVDELYREEMLSRVHLGEEEIAAGLQKARIHIRFRWIYTKTTEEAERMADALEQGTSFDSLFTLQGDPGRFLETTVLRLEKDNPELAKELANARSQEILGPILGSDGSYIIRIDEIWQNPLLTQSAEQQLSNLVTTTLKSMKADELAGEYVRRTMLGANPVIKAEGHGILRSYLAERGLSKEQRTEWEITAGYMTEAGPRPITASPEFLAKTLVTFGDRAFSVADYLRWFQIRQFQLKTGSREAFISSIKRTIWKMVQDHLLSRDAYARGLHLREIVKGEKKRWEAKLLYLAGRIHILRTIQIPDDAVRARYESRKHRYKDTAGRVRALKEVEQEIRLELFREEETKVFYRTIQLLKKEFTYTVDEEAVRKLADRVDSEPSPIDVIFYKPGGTFPRRAFPTIDEQWILFH